MGSTSERTPTLVNLLKVIFDRFGEWDREYAAEIREEWYELEEKVYPLRESGLVKVTNKQIATVSNWPEETWALIMHLLETDGFGGWSTVRFNAVAEVILDNMQSSLEDMTPYVNMLIDCQLGNFTKSQWRQKLKFWQTLSKSDQNFWLYFLNAQTKINIQGLFKLSLETQDRLSHLANNYTGFFTITENQKKTIKLFDQLEARIQQRFLEAWDQRKNSFSLVWLAGNVLTPDSDWPALTAGLNLLWAAGVDVDEAKGFLKHCQNTH